MNCFRRLRSIRKHPFVQWAAIRYSERLVAVNASLECVKWVSWPWRANGATLLYTCPTKRSALMALLRCDISEGPRQGFKAIGVPSAVGHNEYFAIEERFLARRNGSYLLPVFIVGV